MFSPELQTKRYNCEQTLTLLTLLGKHGTNVFEKFLGALSKSGHKKAVDNLRRTEKHIQFGTCTVHISYTVKIQSLPI